MADALRRPFRPQSDDKPADLQQRTAEAAAALLRPKSQVHSSVITSAAGSGWATLPDVVCDKVLLVNNTGADLEVRRGGAGVAAPVLDSSGLEFESLANANELQVRRVDQSTTQVTAVLIATSY